VRWQAKRDTALDQQPIGKIQSAVAAALCRRTPHFVSSQIDPVIDSVIEIVNQPRSGGRM
jgi:hypothetical protein